jgi:hypothetical protein
MGLVAGSVLIVATTAGAAAQQTELDSTLAYVNRTLAQRQFTDNEGQTTVSEVQLAKGTLRVLIIKTKSGNRFSNVYEVALTDVDAGAVVSRDRGGSMTITLGAVGSVKERMDCVMAGGAKTSWELPARRQIWVELDRKAPEVRELVHALTRVLELAKKDPRYGGN